MEPILAKSFSEISVDEMREVEGGILNIINTTVYVVDLYNYYKETKYVTSYNETVIGAGHYDLVKPNPTMPEYNGLYVFTR